MAQQSNLLRSTFGFTLLNATNKIFRFASFLIIARYLGPEKFGYYSVIIATIEILRTFADFGLDSILVRNLSKNGVDINNELNKTLHIKLLLNIIVALIAFIFINVNSPEDKTFLYGVLILSFGSIFYSFSNTLRAKYQAIYEVNKLVIPVAIVNIIYLLILLFVISNNVRIEYIFVAQTALDLGIFFWFYLLSPIESVCKIFGYRIYHRIIKEAFPLAITSGLVVIYSRITLFFLSMLPDKKYVGYYAASYRITESALLVAASVAASLLPLFSSFSIKEDRLAKYFELAARKVILYGLMLSIVISLFSQNILNALYAGKYNGASNTLIILSIWIPFASVNMVFTNLIISVGKQKYIPAIASINLLNNLIANAILVDLYKDQGAAMAALITEGINFVIQIYITINIIKISVNKLLPKPALLLYFMTIALLFCYQGVIPFYISISVVVALLISIYSTREIKMNEIFAVIRK